MNIQVGLLNQGNEPAPIAEPLQSKSSYTLGFDLLFGGNNLAPIGGLFWQHLAFDTADGEDLGTDQIAIPLGLAYRLRDAETSFNLVGIAALAPTLVAEPLFPDGLLSVDNPSLVFSARLGVAAYLDYVTLHFDWWPALSERWENSDERLNFTSIGLGVRF